MKLSRLLSASPVALALGLAFPGTAFAQEAANSVPSPAQAPGSPAASGQDAGGDIVVTGSFIRGAAEDAALPVSVIGGADLAQRGAPTVLDLVKQLPIAGPSLGDSNAFAATSQYQIGAGSINLRGLGGERTLVLLNGRRLVVSPGQGSAGVDTNMIPIAAIGRVEILKDGAAATYGSDAIAGVVNFITRTDLKGFAASAEYRYIDKSAGDYSGSLAYGWSNDWANALFSVGYQRRSEVKVTERKWSQGSYLDNPSFYSIYSNPGVWLPRNAAGAPLGAPIRDANCGATGGFEGFTGTLPVCYVRSTTFNNLIEDEDRVQAYAEFNADLGGNTELHVEALYSHSELPRYRLASSYSVINGPTGPGTAYSVPSTNPGFNDFLRQTGNAALIGTATSASSVFFRPFYNGGNPGRPDGDLLGSRARNLYRFSTSLKGDITDAIGFDVAAGYSHMSSRSRTDDALIFRVQRALNGFGGPNCTGTTPGANGCEYLNPFSNSFERNPVLGLNNPGYISANANSPALARWLFDTQDVVWEQDLFVADAVLNGTLGITLPGGDISWAVGGQYRKGSAKSRLKGNFYDQRITPCPTPGDMSCAIQTGPYTFFSQRVPYDLSEEIYAVFGELSVPITDRLNVQAAIRYEDYGGRTGSTTNPKVAVKWQLFDFLALRGSLGSTFRGPTMSDRSTSGASNFIAVGAVGGTFKAVDIIGNPDIKPETATTYNVGAILETGGLRLIADYWNYRLKDLIVQTPANIIASSVAGVGSGAQFVNCSAALVSLITFNGGVCAQGVTTANDIARIRSDLTNGPTTKTSGIDFDLSYEMDNVFGGTLTLGAVASLVLNYKVAAFINNGVLITPGYEAVGFANYDRNPGTISKWRGNISAEYSLNGHTFRAVINYVDGVDDNRPPVYVQTAASAVPCTTGTTSPACKLITFGQRVKSFTTLDLYYRAPLFEGTHLTVGVENAFDKDPSAARLSLGYDPFIGNAAGRILKAGIRTEF